MSLYNLPDEMLLIIFNYCDAYDIIQLNGVCKRFHCIASEMIMKEKSNHLLITGQMSKKFRERCQPLLLSYKEKFSINFNWEFGGYESKIFYPKPALNRNLLKSGIIEDRYRNCLQMTKDMILFISDEKKPFNNLCAFNRTKNGLVSDDNVIVAKCSTEIMDIYVPRNDIIITYHGDGSIRQWTIESLNGKNYFNKKLLCSACSDFSWFDPYVIDVTPRNIIIGSTCKKGEIEIWKYVPEENSMTDKYIIPNLNIEFPYMDFYSKQYVRVITFDPTGTKFAAIISYGNRKFFKIYDINKCCTEKAIWAPYQLNFHQFYPERYDIYQILWIESNNILYLTKDGVRKMDARTHKCVQQFTELFDRDDERFTCMSSDNQYAIMTGSSYGKLFLWDQRKYNNVIHTFDQDDVGHVDSLQFDSSHMYVAADKIYEFNFTKYQLQFN